MTKEKFNEVINFAIAGEKEAIKFYQELQKKVKFQAQIEMLKEFEDMEKGHVLILENIRNKGFKEIEIKEVTDLHISDYIVDLEPSEDMNYQDILIIAMKKEEKANKLYNEMANNFPDTELEQLFRRLAAEEAEHKLKFEKLYDDEILKEN
jgi:rubrerythrin